MTVLGDWTSSIPLPAEGAADILLNAPLDNPWLALTAAYLSFDVRDADPQLARKLAARAMTAAQVAPRQPARVYEPGSGEATCFSRNTLTRVPWVRPGTCNEGSRSIGRCFPTPEHSLVCLTPMCTRHLPGPMVHRQLPARVVSGPPWPRPHRPSPRRAITYANLMVKASQALTSLGHWSMAWAHLSECLDLVEDERAAFNVHIFAGLIAGWRGDLATAESHQELARPGRADADGRSI